MSEKYAAWSGPSVTSRRRPEGLGSTEACGRDDPHPRIDGAKDQMASKLGRPRSIDEGSTGRHQDVALIGWRLASRAGWTCLPPSGA